MNHGEEKSPSHRMFNHTGRGMRTDDNNKIHRHRIKSCKVGKS